MCGLADLAADCDGGQFNSIYSRILSELVHVIFLGINLAV